MRCRGKHKACLTNSSWGSAQNLLYAHHEGHPLMPTLGLEPLNTLGTCHITSQELSPSLLKRGRSGCRPVIPIASNPSPTNASVFARPGSSVNRPSICIYVCLVVDISKCITLYIYIYTYNCIHICIYFIFATYIYIYIYVYLYTQLCIY